MVRGWRDVPYTNLWEKQFELVANETRNVWNQQKLIVVARLCRRSTLSVCRWRQETSDQAAGQHNPCNLDHWWGATSMAGIACVSWHCTQFCTALSTSLSNPGHQTNILASDFILVIPECFPWRSFIVACRPHSGITTQVPHKMQPLWSESSCLYDAKGFGSSLHCSGPPSFTNCSTFSWQGSQLVHTQSSAVTGESCIGAPLARPTLKEMESSLDSSAEEVC